MPVQEAGPLLKAPPVGAQVDGVRHEPPVAIGANHQLPDVLSKLPLGDVSGADVEDSFPDDPPIRTTYRRPPRTSTRQRVTQPAQSRRGGQANREKRGGCSERNFTPTGDSDAGTDKAADMTSTAKEHPVVAVLCCGGGGGLMVAKGLVTLRGATGHDKRALECDRVRAD